MTIFCPFCGEKLVDEAKFCKNCGKSVENYTHINNDTNTNPYSFQPPVEEKSHTLATVLGFLLAVLIPLFGIIIGIYLVTRNDNSNAKKYGTIIIVLGALVWILSFFTAIFM